jgi:DNA-binding NarL/FixJ family response regulator
MELTPPSPRESTVLHYIAWGYTNKEIGNILNLSVKTIEAHKANGFRKLGLISRAQLVHHAVREGWLTVENVPTVCSSCAERAHLHTHTLGPS